MAKEEIVPCSNGGNSKRRTVGDARRLRKQFKDLCPRTCNNCVPPQPVQSVSMVFHRFKQQRL